MSPTLRVCSLYSDLMNIYADRGNILLLRRRCEWRGIGFEVQDAGPGAHVDPDAHDLFYLGGGQDRDQLIVADDLLASKGEALRAAAAREKVLLGVCGGYQLFGRSYELAPGSKIDGLALLDVETVRKDGPRLIGNVAIETDIEGSVLAGFENHGGRTRLLPGQAALGKVIHGFGNDGRSGFEGARTGNTIGTYLHGPLLPKNAWFADWLIATALGLSPEELPALEDELERATHAGARRAAGV